MIKSIPDDDLFESTATLGPGSHPPTPKINEPLSDEDSDETKQFEEMATGTGGNSIKLVAADS